MAAQVPIVRTNPAYGEVQISAPPRGRLWRETAWLYHWLRGSGVHLVPTHYPMVLLTGGAARTLRYRMRPSGRAIARAWFVGLRHANTGSMWKGSATVTYPDGAALPYLIASGSAVNRLSEHRRPILYVENLAAKSSAVADVSITVTHDSASEDVWIESVACVEVPRGVLTQDATDLGVDIETLRTGQPIHEYTDRTRAISALIRNLADTEMKRNLLNHAFPTVSVTSATLVDLFITPVPIVPRKVGRTDTTGSVTVGVYSRASDGTTVGEITATASVEGSTDTITIDGAVGGGTTLSWREIDLEFRCEDLTTADGRPAAVNEALRVQIKRTAGAGSIQLESVCAYE